MSSARKFLKCLCLVGAFTGLFMILMHTRVQWQQASALAPVEKYWSEKSATDLKAATLDVEALNKVFVNLAASASPTVVNIYVKTHIAAPRTQGYGGMAPDDLFRFFFGNPLSGQGEMTPPAREAQALGSGFVINAQKGILVTNSHVVRMSGHNADNIMVKFVGDSPKSPGFEATVVGVDELSDVAVIKLKKAKNDLKEAPLGDSSKLRVGEWVAAIGNPYGHTHTFTKGVVSALGRSIDELQQADFIQTDASINPGNSGGPLFNLYGEVVGINTAIDARAQGIGFAIPVNTAKAVISQLMAGGEVPQGFIGVVLGELSPQIAHSLGMASDEGALIQDVTPGAPAAAAGIKPYDVATELNGKRLESAGEFSNAIRRLPVNSVATVKLYRDGKIVNVKVKIAKRKSDQELAQAFGKGQGQLSKVERKTGFSVADLTPDLRMSLRLDSTVRGVVIERILPRSPAVEAGLKPGDVITEINRKKDACKSRVTAEKALAASSDDLLLKIQRGTLSAIVPLDLARPPAQGAVPGEPEQGESDDGQ